MNYKSACLSSSSCENVNNENKKLEVNKIEECSNSDEEFLDEYNDDEAEDFNYSFLEYSVKKNKNDLVKETFLDYNLNTLIDIHENIKDKNENNGFLNNSTSNKFINCVIQNIIIK